MSTRRRVSQARPSIITTESLNNLRLDSSVIIRRPIIVTPRPRIKEHQAKKPSRVLRKLWFAICIVGCLGHSYIVTLEYMSYKTVTDIRISHLKELDNAALSICVPFKNSFKRHSLFLPCTDLEPNDTIRYKEMIKKRKEKNETSHNFLKSKGGTENEGRAKKKLKKKVTTATEKAPEEEEEGGGLGDLFKGLKDLTKTLTKSIAKSPKSLISATCFFPQEISEADLMKKYSVDVMDKINMIKIRDQKLIKEKDETDGEDDQWISNITTEFMKTSSRCAKIDLNSRNNNEITQPFVEVSITTVKFKKLFGSIQFNVMMHRFDKLPHSYDTYPVLFNFYPDSKLNGRTIVMQRQTTKNLPHPFESNCKNYAMQSKLFESQGDCIEHCRESYVDYHYLRTKTTYRSDIPNGDMGNKTLMNLVDKNCTAKCHKDCTVIDYVFNLREMYQPMLSTFVFELTIYADLPESTVVHQPHLEFINYLLFIASVIGMWLGSSIYATPIDVVEQIKLVCK